MAHGDLDSLALMRRESGTSRHLHITHLNSPTVFEMDNGQVGSTIQVKGVPFDTATNEELNTLSYRWHQTLLALDEEIAIYVHIIRRPMATHLEGVFEGGFVREVDACYQKKFKSTSCFVNEIFITLVVRGRDGDAMQKATDFLAALQHKSVRNSRIHHREQAMVRLNKIVRTFMSSLAPFRPSLVGEDDEEEGESGLLQFWGRLINFGDKIPFRAPNKSLTIIKGQGSKKSPWERYPDGNIAPFLTARRLFFGTRIESVRASGQSTVATILSLKNYGSHTSPLIFDSLLHLKGAFISTHSFFVESNSRAQKKINQQFIRMSNANSEAVSLMRQLGECQDDLASDRLKAGRHHHTLMLCSDDVEDLACLANQAETLYQQVGFVAVQETLGMEAAFWAQFPGQARYIVRQSLLTSTNFADFCPLHNYPTGYRDGNHLGSAVTLIETPSQTPMFFNFHSRGRGSKNDLTPGHATIIGGNFSGKTVFMGFMDAQMSRYGGRSFFFDRDRSLEIYIRACGGVYSRIHPDEAKGCAFNPFSLPDTFENRSFLTALLCQLVKREDEVEVDAAIARAMKECVGYAYDSLSPDIRTLSHAIALLPIDFPRLTELSVWLRGKSLTGELAWLFDNHEDTWATSATKVGFDFTWLMEQSSRVMTVVSMYLVHRIKASLDGQRVSLYFDEGWQMLDDPYWKSQLKKDLATMRKKNAHIVLATQSPFSIVSSSLSSQFLDNCATNIFFCNSKAEAKHYDAFNITPSELAFIKQTPSSKRLFLFKQGGLSAIGKLNLSGMEDALAVFSGNSRTTKLLDVIRSEVGDDPKHWLPVFHQRRLEQEEEASNA